jgi:glyoxylase-like metal-dependent hydrolase (beta-lactamase superfamily II)
MPETVPVSDLQHGDRVGPLRTVHAPGHTAGHVAFAVEDDDGIVGSDADADANHHRGRVLTGDAVLRTVTPNVGGGDTRQDQPLVAYRDALASLAVVGDRALPGHGTAFDLDDRLVALREHHGDRAGFVHESLATLESDVEGGVTPWAVARDRFGDMDGYHVKFGAGEAFAHLQDLVALDLAARVGDDPLRYRVGDRAGDESDAAGVLDAAWTVA